MSALRASENSEQGVYEVRRSVKNSGSSYDGTRSPSSFFSDSSFEPFIQKKGLSSLFRGARLIVKPHRIRRVFPHQSASGRSASLLLLQNSRSDQL